MLPSNLDANLGKLTRLSQAKTRSISAENFTGKKGKGGMAIEGRGKYAARDLEQGWKVSPCIDIQAGETVILAEIEGPGAIQSMWYGGTGARDHHRTTILRIYWEDQDQPSVECPLGDFFASGWGYAQIDSIPVTVNPNTSFNCFWPMPFRHKCRITIQNLRQEQINCFYQINYTLSEVPDDLAYFHAQFRRTNPLAYGEAYTIVNDIRGQGQYVGTAMAWGTNNNGSGSVKGKSNFLLMVTTNSRPSVELVLKIILEVPMDGLSTTNIVNTPHLTQEFLKSSVLMVFTAHNNGLRCTAGISKILSDFRKIYN